MVGDSTDVEKIGVGWWVIMDRCDCRPVDNHSEYTRVISVLYQEGVWQDATSSTMAKHSTGLQLGLHRLVYACCCDSATFIEAYG